MENGHVTASFSFGNMILSPWRQPVLERALRNQPGYRCVNHFLNNVAAIFNTNDISVSVLFWGLLSHWRFSFHPPFTFQTKVRWIILIQHQLTLTVAGLHRMKVEKKEWPPLYLSKRANSEMYLLICGVYCIGFTTCVCLSDLPVVPDRKRRSESPAPRRSPAGL